MDVANLQIAVSAETEARQAVLEGILDFIGVRVAPQSEAEVLFCEGQIPPGPKLPLIAIGEAPMDVSALAEVRALRYHTLVSALHEAQTVLRDQDESDGLQTESPALVGSSASMRTLRALARRAADADAHYIVAGEPGTGKESLARLVHARSGRAEAPFVPLDCSVVPEALLESELFGHERGAFAGALTTKIGRLELAGEGSLYIDHVDRLPYPLQVKLLRAIQDGHFERTGSDERIPLKVRIVVGVQADLEQMSRDGEFREDLYYALSGMALHTVPLRERADDVPVLISNLSAAIEQTQHLTLRLSLDVLGVLQTYPWPGNVRELRNLLERLSLQFGGEVITTRDLPAKFSPSRPSVQTLDVDSQADEELPENVRLPVNGLDLKDYLARLERSLIEQALDDTGAVVARAADRLHIRRTTLVEKMRKYGISRA